MTQLRRQKDAISNYFDTLLDGIGHRGSSFMDADAVTHDGATKRWLVQEFKHEGDVLEKAQHWMLRDLSTLQKWFTVWVVVKRQDGRVGFAEYQVGKKLEIAVITVEEYRDRFRAWWANERYVARKATVRVSQIPPDPPHEFAGTVVTMHPPVDRLNTDEDLDW